MRLRPQSRVALTFAAVAALMAMNVAAHAAEPSSNSTTDTTTVHDDLDASWQRPWNPPHVVPRREAWERVTLLPQRIATLPLSALGYGLESGLAWLENSGRITTGPPSDRNRVRHGVLALEPPNMGGNVGIGAALMVRYGVLYGPKRVELQARQTLTVHGYSGTNFGIVGSPGFIDYAYYWRPQEVFYGVAPETNGEDRANYASQSEQVRVGLRTVRGIKSAPGGANVWSLWTGPRTAVTSEGRSPNVPSFEELFPDYAANVIDRRIDHMVYGASVTHDGRGGIPHWSHGWRGVLSFEGYGAPIEALALKSAQEKGATFWEAIGEAEAAKSFWRDPRTFRLLVRFEDRNVLSNGEHFMPGDLGLLGGGSGLAGFRTGRFRGMDIVLTRLTYIFPVSRKLEFDLHSELGNAYDDVWHDAHVSNLEHSFGFAIRARWDKAPLAAAGLDFSREEIRLHYAIGGIQ